MSPSRIDLLLLARAVGDFKYLGLFKGVKGSRLAVLDSRLLSPL